MVHFDLIFFSVIFFRAYSIHGTFISLKQGLLRGTTERSVNGGLYNAFYAIPYAEPPINDLRFKPPVEARPWTGIFDAVKNDTFCIQIIENTDIIAGSEDCLNLNVFSPLDAKPGDDIPVIVFLLGGMYVVGYSGRYKPCYQMTKDIIIVIPNHRLGALGLLSTGDSVVSGNLALKDQTMVLRWVQQNIRSFGGDPNRVTLHGFSSGANCAHLHMLSPLSKGLFHRVMLQSGTGIPSSTYYDTKTARNIAFEFGKKLSCVTNDTKILINCLMNIKAERLIRAQGGMYVLWGQYPRDAGFRPTVEDEKEKGAFLVQLPIFAPYQDTNVSLLIGMTTGEGSGEAISMIAAGEEKLNKLNSQYEMVLPIEFSYKWTSKSVENRYITRLLRKHYLNDSRMYTNTRTIKNYMNMITDMQFGIGVFQVARKYEGRKYVYLYDYWANYTTQNTGGYFSERLGVSHGDDIGLTYCIQATFSSLTTNDLTLASEWMTRIVNFAYSGDPNRPYSINTEIFEEWKPVRSNRIEYLFVQYNGSMMTGFGEESYNFLKRLPINSRFYEELSSTYT